jgi:hypothetical protein
MKHPILLSLLFTCAHIGPDIASASSEDQDLEISVRSEIDRPFEGWGKADVREHGKDYFIASIAQTQSTVNLVMPVDEAALLVLLRQQLTKRGFREVTTPQPEIILTILYGRGYLKNPYIDDTTFNEMTDPPTVTLSAANMKILGKRLDYGYEEKVQNANHEKLFIRVTAWANPADQTPKKPGEWIKPKELWHTTMIIGDPGNRDLNQFMKKMLLAGSNFFDREMEDDEEFINTDLPEGVIHYGDTIILDDE